MIKYTERNQTSTCCYCIHRLQKTYSIYCGLKMYRCIQASNKEKQYQLPTYQLMKQGVS